MPTFRAFMRVSAVTVGRTLARRAMALSTSMPVRWPDLSFRIAPPKGTGVASVMPARRRAALLATMAWPSARCSRTGLSAEIASMSEACRNRFSGQPVSIQPRPKITSPGRADASRTFSRAATSAAEADPSRLRVSSRSPTPSRWTWLSVKPGNRAAPFRSIVRVAGPTRAAAAARSPTRTIRPPRTATAWAVGPAASPV